MTTVTPALNELVAACAWADPTLGLAGLVESLAQRAPGYVFRPVLTRAGWYRPGGVLDASGRPLADNLAGWLQEQADDDLEDFIDRFQGEGLVATRLQGRTHYLSADIGDAPEAFVQLEVEELQEVVDRELLPDGWLPDDLEDLLDPLERRALEPTPLGRPRFVFRRIQPVPELLGDGAGMAPLKRFMYDWAASSAGRVGRFSHHWVLALRDAPGSDGEPLLSAKPIPAVNAPDVGLGDYSGQRGESLLDAIRTFDQAAGYPFAWFFTMLTSARVSFAVGEAVLADLAEDYDYLPPRDALILSAWANKRYAV